ncbi:MAG: DUF6868 family protein [Sneathiella sp.]|uniref:DUF6868 family protein n=1 Tax=Sneathiella sp. TaxID=1964365 RepID=UPI003002410D
MVELTGLTSFFGWMSAINILVLIIIALALMTLRGVIAPLHSKLLGVPEADLPGLYFRYVANYKIAVIVLNLVPYVALKLMA